MHDGGKEDQDESISIGYIGCGYIMDYESVRGSRMRLATRGHLVIIKDRVTVITNKPEGIKVPPKNGLGSLTNTMFRLKISRQKILATRSVK